MASTIIQHYSILICHVQPLPAPASSGLSSLIPFSLCPPPTLCLPAQSRFTNFTVLSNDPSYASLLEFSIQNLRFVGPKNPKPAAIILPETVEQLAQSVACCREGFLEIRARCGGHSYEGTSFVANDGASFVIVDMMNLNGVQVDLGSETAWVEAGATLGQTYHAIAQSTSVHAFSAGSCPTVGVGGHISGGGFGFLSRKYGVAADNVVDAVLVTAEGQVLDRESMGEDVFWAIRGGGGGIWGIVYAWKIKLLKVAESVTSCVVWRRKHVAELVNKWQLVAPKLQGELYLSCFVGTNLPEAKASLGISATFKAFFLGPRSEALSILALQFPELGLEQQDCHETSWIESVVFFSGLGDGATVADLGDRYLQDKHYFKAKSDYVRALIPPPGMEAAFQILEKEPKGYVIMDPYGGIMENISSDAIAFPHRRGNLFTIQYLVEWHEEDDRRSKELMQWVNEFYTAMTPYVSRGPRAAYVNYIDFDLGMINLTDSSHVQAQKDAVEVARVWGEKYFLHNYDRLVRAKTQIDPTNVFHNQQGIPPISSTHSQSY